MALPKINFSAHESCDSQNIVFTDTTGSYDAVTNVTGWGAPNSTLGMIQDAEIVDEED